MKLINKKKLFILLILSVSLMLIMALFRAFDRVENETIEFEFLSDIVEQHSHKGMK